MPDAVRFQNPLLAFDKKLRHQRRGQGEVLQGEVLPDQHHTPPHLHHLPHNIRITDHPAINPHRCILPIPILCGVGCFEDQLPPAVVDYHAELPGQIGGCYRSEDIVQAVVVDSYIRGGFNIGKKY
ncbi:MAG: hypothetical protein FD170_2704 [Bacteroidetes bacterium]|nr:MAG: hypothetical protein FD170_2704 [Bacteroidota bacterium]